MKCSDCKRALVRYDRYMGWYTGAVCEECSLKYMGEREFFEMCEEIKGK